MDNSTYLTTLQVRLPAALGLTYDPTSLANRLTDLKPTHPAMCSDNAKLAWSVTFTTNTWRAYHSCMKAGSQPWHPTYVTWMRVMPSERLGLRSSTNPLLICFMLGLQRTNEEE
jgi:hypothetical protein